MSIYSDGGTYNVSLSEYCYMEGCDEPTYRLYKPRYNHKSGGWYDGDEADYYGFGEDYDE